MSLADDILQQASSRNATASPRSSSPGSLLETAKRMRRTLTESRGYLTLSPVEVEAIRKHLLAENRIDPFVRGNLTTADLEALQLQVDDSDGGGTAETVAEPSQQSAITPDRKPELIPAHLALVAPNITPGYDMVVPPSVLNSIRALTQPTQNAQPAAASQAPAAPQGPIVPAPSVQESVDARVASMVGTFGVVAENPLQVSSSSTVEPLTEASLAKNLASAFRRGKKANTVRKPPVPPPAPRPPGHSPQGSDARARAQATIAAL